MPAKVILRADGCALSRPGICLRGDDDLYCRPIGGLPTEDSQRRGSPANLAASLPLGYQPARRPHPRFWEPQRHVRQRPEIGQREKDQTPEEAARLQFPEKDLKHGDEIRLGKTTFRVEVFVPAGRTECSVEIPEDRKPAAEVLPGVFQCEACCKKAEQANRKEAPKPKPKVCAKCGRDVSAEMGEHRHGQLPLRVVPGRSNGDCEMLLGLARAGDANAVAIQGYQIVKKLGAGGMGAVYLAKHEKSGGQVALKVMLPQVAVDEDSKRSFLRETENTKALKHPNVAQLYDSGCCNGTFFFTLELCEGGSIGDLMEARHLVDFPGNGTGLAGARRSGVRPQRRDPACSLEERPSWPRPRLGPP